jgi:hypothetical protein
MGVDTNAMSPALEACLEDLEARIDPAEEERLFQAWIDFTQDRFAGELFAPKRDRRSTPIVDWPTVSVNEAIRDYDTMALQQYGQCSRALAEGSGSLMCVRANYGTSIVPLLFGVEPFVLDDELDTLPTSWPLNDVGTIEHLVDSGVPRLRGGYSHHVLEMGRRYQAIAERYPKIGRYVHIYHPDFQGPLDICEVVWGSSMFYALIDRPALVEAFLEIVTETYVLFMQAWMNIAPFKPSANAHWGMLHGGNIMLRDDSAMNLSPAMFDRFVRPYDQRLLTEFGGGAIHFCGRGDHYMPCMGEMDDLHAIHMSQPAYNDMEAIFASTVDRGIKLIGLTREAAELALASGRALHSQVHVV